MPNDVKKVLVLGATGMLGHAIVNELARDAQLEVWASLRNPEDKAFFSPEISQRLIANIDVLKPEQLRDLFKRVTPQIVINCIGLVKQAPLAQDVQKMMAINATLPHQLAHLSQFYGARLIHFSTDCVFSGLRGNYCEAMTPDATDLYGHSKLLGEVNSPHVLTLRTSIIGHELSGSKGLLEWFLAQGATCKGYTQAIFSGLPTIIMARLIRQLLVLPDFSGTYHVSSQPISKYNLLRAIAVQYKKAIEIVPSDEVVINRSLNSERFTKQTGWVAPSWDVMIEDMYTDRARYVQE